MKKKLIITLGASLFVAIGAIYMMNNPIDSGKSLLDANLEALSAGEGVVEIPCANSAPVCNFPCSSGGVVTTCEVKGRQRTY